MHQQETLLTPDGAGTAGRKPPPFGSPDTAGSCATGEEAERTAVMDAEIFLQLSEQIMAAMNTVIDGKEESVRLSLTVLLAGGHLLLEDVPGVGKTLLAKTLARTVDCSVARIQFTPDLLPSDITGVSIFNQSSQVFEFRPGAIFANIVIGDEINRASAKTQSALLESMAERQVSVDGTTYTLHTPFMVIATQNPIEMEGTYPLPEAQRDRFMARISMGYPDTVAELAMLETHQSVNPLDSVQAVVTEDQIAAMIESVAAVHVSPAVRAYTVALGQATRSSSDLRLGASPRALLQLLRAAKAAAALRGRGFVLPDDIRNLVQPVLGHRLLLERSAASHGVTVEAVIQELLVTVPVPGGAGSSGAGSGGTAGSFGTTGGRPGRRAVKDVWTG